MHIFGQKNAARKRAAQEKAAQAANMQDAQELIAMLMEQNKNLAAENDELKNQLGDLQELTATLIEK